ncbi:hypothetical protein SARC_05389 [Sphaeroforma arctica JP610]|uniref:Uncharacterized protein n=1 Tax=Sphaeroforma arctica JP610 TaxID=667725 RepID=A0A0L0FZS2_9EUKA|nr:hypothetical protein SARC_05389 [Sphaeroforma arctica JP610]KNC82325.1 hypothetical protein SARC_05389 [Sphaeroforma arctica JP610]|eukprot:XP_014156227.1 hypothetical protein SARC_05389 [Sphaeroforma arctica JP610]
MRGVSQIVIPSEVFTNDQRKLSTMDCGLHQPVENLQSDEVTELNKTVDDYTIQMEIAHDRHDAEDVVYYASLIAIKKILQAQRRRDHQHNQKYKEMIRQLKSNWEASSQKSEFINNHDLDTLTRTLNAFAVMLETNDAAPHQWISVLMQSFDPIGSSYFILRRHHDELGHCPD